MINLLLSLFSVGTTSDPLTVTALATPTMPILSVNLSPVRAAMDTQQRRPYNPNAPRRIKQIPTATVTVVPHPTNESLSISVANLLKRRTIPVPSRGDVVKSDESYMGSDVWLPGAPKVEKPQSVFNAATLAYIGDCIYELYARRHFLFPPLSIEEYNDRVMSVVRCEAQDALLQKLVADNYLTEKERDVLRWGKNINSSKTRTKKRAGVAVYNRASSLETLIGYLYLTNAQRVDEVMLKLGFSTESSMQPILEGVNGIAN